MKEEELKEQKIAKIIDPLGVTHRVNEMERIHDGPFLLDLWIVVVEKAQNLLFDLNAVMIEWEECPVVVKIALTKSSGELNKILNLLIPIRNLLCKFENSWDTQPIGIRCNNEVHCSLLQHIA